MASDPAENVRAASRARRPWSRLDQLVAAICAGLVLYKLATLLGLGDLIRLGDRTPVVLALVTAIVLCVYGWARWLWMLLAALALVVAIVALTPVIDGPARALIRRDALSASGVDAVVVLNGGVTPDSLLGPTSLDRLLSGVQLVKGGLASAIVVTAPDANFGSYRSTPVPDVRRIVGLVPEARLLLVTQVKNTSDEAERVAELARKEKWRRVVLVTSPLHTRRACAAFEATGLDVICVPSEDRDLSFGRLTGSARLSLFRQWLHERAGILWHRVRGGRRVALRGREDNTAASSHLCRPLRMCRPMASEKYRAEFNI